MATVRSVLAGGASEYPRPSDDALVHLSGKYKVDTAFYAYTQSVAYGWSVRVTGPGYSKTHKWSGLLALAHAWTGSATATIALNQRGEFYAYASGKATLWNGLVCSSAHPTDIEGIY